MGQGGSSPRSAGRKRSESASSATSALSSFGAGSTSALLKDGSGSSSGQPQLKPKEYLGPDGGFLIPMSGVYPNVAQDWDVSTVMQLIDQRKLAPFFRGLQDELDTADLAAAALDPQPLEKMLDSVGLKQNAECIGHHGRQGMRAKEPAAHRKAELAAYLEGTAECPICMMNFPGFMNTARCCEQPICTECLVQIKRQDPDANHLEPEAVACPFCVEANFGVLYEAPPPAKRKDHKGVQTFADSSISSSLRASTSRTSSSDSNGSPLPTESRPRRKSVPADKPEVVLIDELHPNFAAKVEAVRNAVDRRANRRIVFRRVGDRLIPVGISSGRTANGSNQEATATVGSGTSTSLRPRIRRPRGNTGGSRGGSNDFSIAGHDLEEMMVNEAIRLSLLHADEDRARQEEQQRARGQTSQSEGSSATAAGVSTPLRQADGTELEPSSFRNSQLLSATMDSLPIPVPISALPTSASELTPSTPPAQQSTGLPLAPTATARPALASQLSNIAEAPSAGYQALADDDSTHKSPNIVQHDERAALAPAH